MSKLMYRYNEELKEIEYKNNLVLKTKDVRKAVLYCLILLILFRIIFICSIAISFYLTEFFNFFNLILIAEKEFFLNAAIICFGALFFMLSYKIKQYYDVLSRFSKGKIINYKGSFISVKNGWYYDAEKVAFIYKSNEIKISDIVNDREKRIDEKLEKLRKNNW